MKFKKHIGAALLAAFGVGMALPGNPKNPGEEQQSPGVLSLPALEIRAMPKLLPQNAPHEEKCKFLDERALEGIYHVLEEFNEKVGADFQIVALDDTAFSAMGPSAWPRTISQSFASAYQYQAEAIKMAILASQTISVKADENNRPCPMERASNALSEFMAINTAYEEIVIERETNRREGVITPEMLENRPQIFII